MECRVCPRKCGVDRLKKAGVCGSFGLRIARWGLHEWEEPPISGNKGSGTIFFSGCPLKCVYCQNYNVSHFSQGYDITASRLAEIFKELEDMGAHNINLVTPTHYRDGIIEALNIYRPSIPIVYNTSGYESVESLEMLAPYIDIYLTDLRYMDKVLAHNYSMADNYPQTACAAILKMKENQPKDIFANGIMQKGIIIRQLLLPNSIENSKSAVKWIEENLGNLTYLSLMSQYTPFGGADKILALNRKIKPIEYKILCNFAQKLGFVNVFVQERESSSEIYIPNFEGENL